MIHQWKILMVHKDLGAAAIISKELDRTRPKTLAVVKEADVEKPSESIEKKSDTGLDKL